MESMDEEIKVLEKCNPAHQTSLQSENIPDPMEGEQTWPTEEELAEAEGNTTFFFCTFELFCKILIQTISN